jgi:Putative peptidoglycan binding domain
MARRFGVALAALAVAAPAAAAHARTLPPRLLGLRCVPACSTTPKAYVGGKFQLRGARLYRGMRVSFRWAGGAVATTLQHTHVGWLARVPAGVRLGTDAVTVRDRAGRRSNVRHLRVLARPRPKPPVATQLSTAPGALPVALRGNGMWIWELSKTEGGDVDAIGQRAQAAGLATVFVKSSDGSDFWPQFNSTLVATLHAYGLHVCAWQFVYGSHPALEAQAGAAAVADGADCLVIDAESDYQGRYAAAQTFMNSLRAAIGEDYPLALTSFPYVDYHPGLPYSVFLGPGGAQANVPQVYWKAIGGGVSAVSAHTWMHNRIYGVPIAPLGQAYGGTTAADIARFRQIWTAYGVLGMSWWSWQAASDTNWSAIAAAPPAPVALADPGWPALQLKAKGDEVVWLQQHLSSADPTVPIDGVFGSQTDQALRSFQLAQALPATGVTDAATWQSVLALPVVAVDWSAKSRRASARATAASAPRSEISELGRGG